MKDQTPSEVEPFFKALAERKARGVVALDVRGLSGITDFMVLCSGMSNRQVSALGEHMVLTMKKAGRAALGVEGLTDGRWVLLDYGGVVVHIFYEPAREFYDLEGLWTDAKRIRPVSAKE